MRLMRFVGAADIETMPIDIMCDKLLGAPPPPFAAHARASGSKLAPHSAPRTIRTARQRAAHQGPGSRNRPTRPQRVT